MAVHGDNGGEVADLQFPERLWAAEFLLPMDAMDGGDVTGQDLGGAADGMEVDAAEAAAGLKGGGAHAALAQDATQAETFEDGGHVRLFAAGRGGAGGGDAPAGAIGHDHRATMIDHHAPQIQRCRGTLGQVPMHGVTPGDQPAGKGDGVSGTQGAHRRLVQGQVEGDGHAVVG